MIMKPAKAYSGTQSVVRALRLLKLFHAARPDLSFAQIQARSGLNRSTAFRMLTALEAEGMIERHPATEGYRLGPQIAALGQRATVTCALGDLARGEMTELAESTGALVVLGTLDGEQPVVHGKGEIPAFSTAPGSEGMVPRIGGGLPAHATSIGKVLLAHLSDFERAQILSCGLPRLTDKTLTNLERLNQDLDFIRTHGYGLSMEEMREDFSCVAVPVHDADGRVVAALGIGGPAQQLPRTMLEQWSEQLKAASACITRDLGGVAVA